MYKAIVKQACADKNVTQLNKDNLTALIGKMSSGKLKNELGAKVGAIELSQKHSTLDYYLKDVADNNRFKTAWIYVDE